MWALGDSTRPSKDTDIGNEGERLPGGGWDLRDLAGCSKVFGAWKFFVFEFEVAPWGLKRVFSESTRND